MSEFFKRKDRKSKINIHNQKIQLYLSGFLIHIVLNVKLFEGSDKMQKANGPGYILRFGKDNSEDSWTLESVRPAKEAGEHTLRNNEMLIQGSLTELTIPDSFKNEPVSEMWENAISHCPDLEKLDFPESWDFNSFGVSPLGPDLPKLSQITVHNQSAADFWSERNAFLRGYVPKNTQISLNKTNELTNEGDVDIAKDTVWDEVPWTYNFVTDQDAINYINQRMKQEPYNIRDIHDWDKVAQSINEKIEIANKELRTSIASSEEISPQQMRTVVESGIYTDENVAAAWEKYAAQENALKNIQADFLEQTQNLEDRVKSDEYYERNWIGASKEADLVNGKFDQLDDLINRAHKFEKLSPELAEALKKDVRDAASRILDEEPAHSFSQGAKLSYTDKYSRLLNNSENWEVPNTDSYYIHGMKSVTATHPEVEVKPSYTEVSESIKNISDMIKEADFYAPSAEAWGKVAKTMERVQETANKSFLRDVEAGKMSPEQFEAAVAANNIMYQDTIETATAMEHSDIAEHAKEKTPLKELRDSINVQIPGPPGPGKIEQAKELYEKLSVQEKIEEIAKNAGGRVNENGDIEIPGPPGLGKIHVNEPKTPDDDAPSF